MSTTLTAAEARTVDLPWPDRILHPNARPHHMAKARATKKARTNAGWLAIEAGLTVMQADALKASIIFSPPDNRQRDIDGMLSSIKAYLDGIRDVVGIDDSKWAIELCRGIPRKGGNVRVILEAA